MNRYLNWKTFVALGAMVIVAATLQYTNGLAAKLAREERKEVVQWGEAIRLLATDQPDQDLSFALAFVDSNTTIPVIQTDAEGKILAVKNIDTSNVRDSRSYLNDMIVQFRRQQEPLQIMYGGGVNNIYYGESYLLRELRLFPYVQLLVIFLFLVVVLIALTAANRAIQNQVWVGLSKETAHQLGTPLTSMEGWVELLDMELPGHPAVEEMRNDLGRLKLVADRFSKVGSTPVLQEEDLNARIENMVDYMRKRAPEKVTIQYKSSGKEMPLLLNGPLFDWVVENLLRNALDAMDGKGNIHVQAEDHQRYVVVDVTDSGAGIAQQNVRKVFKPGFSTKKRGWGLGLSLSRRIIEHYHRGTLRVKESIPGKGTTFRIQIWR